LDLSFRQIFPDRQGPEIFVEGHGREKIDGRQLDVSETIGWFTSYYPLQLPLSAHDTVSTAVKVAKDTRRRVPGNGRPYLAYCCYGEDGGAKLRARKCSEILLNFHGRFQQLEDSTSLLIPLDQSVLLEQSSPGICRSSLINVEIKIVKGQMCMVFEVNSRMKHQAALRRWSSAYTDGLTKAAQYLDDCQHRLTRSDVPLLDISYQGLDNLLNKYLLPLGVASKCVQDIYPCTALQEGLLLSRKRDIASYANTFVFSCWTQVDGCSYMVSSEKLVQAWKTVIARHSIFRTIFADHPETGRAIQILLSETNEPQVQRLRSLSDSPEEALAALPSPTFSPQEFEYRVTMCQAQNDKTACRLDIGHTLMDFASYNILLRDLAASYNGQVLAPAPEFRSAVEYMMKQSEGDRLRYWSGFLAGVQPCHFPTCHSSDPDKSRTHESIALCIDDSVDIYSFCKTKEISRSTLLHVAWALVLARWTGTDQPCFGYLSSGRDMGIDGLDDMVAPLVNLLIGRVDLSAGLSDALKGVSQYSIDSLRFQHTSLAEIEHHLGLRGQHLFNTVLSVHDVGLGELPSDGLQIDNKSEDDPHEVSGVHTLQLATIDEKRSLI
jgi:hypothetical protein